MSYQPQLPVDLTDPIITLSTDQARERLNALLGKKIRATVSHSVDGTPRIIEGALTSEIGLYTAEDATVRYPGSTVHVDHRNLLDVEEIQDPPATIDDAAQTTHELILRRTGGDTELADSVGNSVHDAYRIGWNRSLAARPEPPVTGAQAATLRWAAERLRGVPIDATALTGPVWFGAGWQDAASHLDDLADSSPDEEDSPGTELHHCVPTQWAYDQACAALDKATSQVVAVRALHAPETHYHRANPYGWTADCDHCDNPVRDTAWDLTEHHFSDEHGELRCRIRPRRTCTHCVTVHGEEAHWPCETAELVKETDDAHS